MRNLQVVALVVAATQLADSMAAGNHASHRLFEADLSPLQSQLPFSFSVGNRASLDLLSSLPSASVESQIDLERSKNITTWYDQSTGFVLEWEVITYLNLTNPKEPFHAAVHVREWVLRFSNNGSDPTPILRNIAALNTTIHDQQPTAIRDQKFEKRGQIHPNLPTAAPAPPPPATTLVRRFRGSFASPLDYSGVNVTLTNPGTPIPPEGPLLNSTRVWGNVIFHTNSSTVAASAKACRDLCLKWPKTGGSSRTITDMQCGGMAFTELEEWKGCWLVGSVSRFTSQDGFTSWSRTNSSDSISWAPDGGRSSNGELPFWTVIAGGGQAATYSLGWSGNWAATVKRYADNLTTSIVAVHPTFAAVLLPAAEPVRSMRVVEVLFKASPESGDYHLGVNVHRRLFVRNKVPRSPDGSKLLGALVASWSWKGWPQVTLENQLWHVAAVKNSTSVEAFWLDAGWFNGGFPNGVGNWQLPIDRTVDKNFFPNGTLFPLAAAAHGAPNPVQTVIWFEPERVAAGTWIAEHHPDFLVPKVSGNLLNLGKAEARDFMTEYLSAAVSNYSLDVLRLDFNTDPAANWLAGDEQDNASFANVGMTEQRYIQGLYTMWDTVLAEHPGLLIDDCASGGRRIDGETLARSVPLWRSDNPGDSIQQQVQSMGLSAFAPISSGGVAWVDPYTWRSSGITGKTADWGLSGWKTLMSNSTLLDTLRAAVAETQRLRAPAIFGDYFPLTPISFAADTWAVYQFHCTSDLEDCQNGSGFVAAFRRSASPQGQFVANLRGIDPSRTYVVISRQETYGVSHSDPAMPGNQLASLTLNLGVNESLIIEYALT